MDHESTGVLLITSDPVLAAIYRLRLELDDYHITWADPGNAIERLEASRSHLIYLDIDSVGGGSPLLEQLLASPATADRPVIWSPGELRKSWGPVWRLRPIGSSSSASRNPRAYGSSRLVADGPLSSSPRGSWAITGTEPRARLNSPGFDGGSGPP